METAKKLCAKWKEEAEKIELDPESIALMDHPGNIKLTALMLERGVYTPDMGYAKASMAMAEKMPFESFPNVSQMESTEGMVEVITQYLMSSLEIPHDNDIYQYLYKTSELQFLKLFEVLNNTLTEFDEDTENVTLPLEQVEARFQKKLEGAMSEATREKLDNLSKIDGGEEAVQYFEKALKQPDPYELPDDLEKGV